jgi:pyruvate dehydrogenase E1 component alpha subunit
MYGIPSRTCDGNNVLEMYGAARLAVDHCRHGRGPRAIVAETFRMGGHATDDEREARELFAAETFSRWGKRDPIGLYEEYLVGRGISRATLQEVERGAVTEMEAAARDALGSRSNLPAAEAARFEGVSRGGTLVSLDDRPR